MNSSTESPDEHEHHCASSEMLPNSCVRVRVHAHQDEIQNCKKKALKIVNKEVVIPGFRKGKAPDNLINQQFSVHVEKAFREELTTYLLNKGIHETRQPPLFNKVLKAEIKELSPEKALLEAEYEVEPKALEISLEGFSFEPINSFPERDSYEDTIRTFQLMRGSHQRDDVGLSAEGDLIYVDIDFLGETPQRVCERKSFLLVPKRLSPWLFEGLIGKKIGETFEIEQPAEADSSSILPLLNQEKKVATPRFRITVADLSKITPHPLDDSFWKKLGVNSEESFKTRFNEQMEGLENDFIQDEKRNQLFAFLKKNHPFDLPKSLVRSEVEVILKNTLHDYLKQGVSKSWLTDNIQMLVHEAEKIAEIRLRQTYLLIKEAIKRDLKLEAADINMARIIEESVRPFRERIVLPEMDEDEKNQRLYIELIVKKTFDILIEELDKSAT